MRLDLKILILSASLALFGANPASARNYDCSKAGNANKAACKSPGAASPTTSRTTKTVQTTKVTAGPSTSVRNYDCTKAGNKNKVACRSVSAPASASVSETTTKTRNYDCTKAGNANKKVCKTSDQASPAPGRVQTTTTTAGYDCTKFYNRMRSVCRTQTPTTTTTTVAPPSRPMARPASNRSTHSGSLNTAAAGPDGATAKCRDGSLSHSAHRSGTCSRHGGVAQWY